ncbi:MAG: hypothetical protein HY775_07465 [Acidobacteria bacterium]|nr:hypothetical protein [Acidobacteriota bacterium]
MKRMKLVLAAAALLGAGLAAAPARADATTYAPPYPQASASKTTTTDGTPLTGAAADVQVSAQTGQFDASVTAHTADPVAPVSSSGSLLFLAGSSAIGMGRFELPVYATATGRVRGYAVVSGTGAAWGRTLAGTADGSVTISMGYRWGDPGGGSCEPDPQTGYSCVSQTDFVSATASLALTEQGQERSEQVVVIPFELNSYPCSAGTVTIFPTIWARAAVLVFSEAWASGSLVLQSVSLEDAPCQ